MTIRCQKRVGYKVGCLWLSQLTCYRERSPLTSPWKGGFKYCLSSRLLKDMQNMEIELLWSKQEEGEWGPWRREKVTGKTPPPHRHVALPFSRSPRAEPCSTCRDHPDSSEQFGNHLMVFFLLLHPCIFQRLSKLLAWRNIRGAMRHENAHIILSTFSRAEAVYLEKAGSELWGRIAEQRNEMSMSGLGGRRQ